MFAEQTAVPVHSRAEPVCVCACVSQITANSQITGIMEDGCEGSIHRNNNNARARTHTHTATV